MSLAINGGPIVIAGGGIGGLSAALALLRRGVPVKVYEQASEFRELGAGIQLGPNGTRALFGLGLEDALRAVSSEAAAKEIRLWNSGKTWKLFDLGKDSIERFGAPYLMVSRSDLHRVLVDAVKAIDPDALGLRARAVAAETSEDHATLVLADGRRIAGAAVVAADGVHSVLRRQLAGEPAATFTGMLAWRGSIPMDALPDELRRPVGTNWVGPGGHVVTYPIKKGAVLNFVGIAERDDWRSDSWLDKGTTEECASDFHGWHPLIQTMIRAIEQPYKWALLVREPIERWVGGRVALLGAAAHATLPFLAQGAIMAIEDGIVLARAIERHPGDIPRALKVYEATRRERANAVVRGSAENAKRFHNPTLADAAAAEAYVDRAWEPEAVRRRYDWLFEHDAATAELASTA
jgi:salicylate hydroxylase